MADAAIQTLARQMELLVQQVAALSSHLGQNSAAAPLPTYAAAIAADAVDSLVHDPRLPAHLRHVADLLRVAFPLLLSDDHIAIAQRVYTDLITAVQSPSNDAPSLPTAHDPMPSNSMSQSSRIRFVEPPDAPPVLSGHTQPSKTPHGDVSIHPVISGSGFTLTLVVSYHIPLASE